MSLIRTDQLGKKFPIKSGMLRRVIDHETAVEDVSIQVDKGEILGLVGESGSGKTTLARLLLRLVSPTSGAIYFEDQRIDDLSENEFRIYRRWLQPVFQDPQESLDPRFKVQDCIAEGMIHATDWSAPRREQKINKLIRKVGLDEGLLNRYPHQLSGGQRQRVGIARALAVEPDILICDEPTSALDVSIQAQIINLLLDLRDQFELTYIFISHDLNLIRFISDRVAVMKEGRIVEKGSAARIYQSPDAEYTEQLLQSSKIHRKTLS